MSKGTIIGAFARLEVTLGVSLFIILIPLIVTVPYYFPPEGNVASAAAFEGYSNRVAHLIVVIFAFIVGLIYMSCRRLMIFSDNVLPDITPKQIQAVPFTKRHFGELILVATGALFLYFPLFLARHGPFIEDNYFMSVLHRINAGQTPYVDFEFLYGPLMVSVASLWTSAFGFSMVSYYSLLALMEVTLFVSLLWFLQTQIPKNLKRYGTFMLLSILFFNTLMGVNWSGIRRLLPVLILIYFAKNPSSKKVVIVGSMMIGALLAFSHDYGTVGLVAALSMYGLNFIRGRILESLLLVASVLLLSLGTWMLISFVILRGAITAYVGSSIETINRFGVGEQGFPFYWTLNSISVFALIILTAAIIGYGIGKKSNSTILAGDYLLFGGIIFALVGLKSGLNRADMWHLAWPMLVIIFAFVLPLPKSLFQYSRAAGNLATTLIVILAFTYLLALGPTASYYLSGLASGFTDTITSRQRPAMTTTRAPSIESEKSQPSPYIVELGAYLADKKRIEIPVVFYEETWGLDKMIGVYNQVYPIDDFLLSDHRGLEIREFLEKQPDAFVLMDRVAYERNFMADPVEEESAPMTDTTMKIVLSWISTVHYQYIKIEDREKGKRWDRTIGSFVFRKYQKIEEFGPLVLLGKRSGSVDTFD